MVPGQREWHVVDRARAPVVENPPQIVGDPSLVAEDLRLSGRLVLEDDLQALVQVAGDVEPLGDQVRVECRLREDRRVRAEEHRRAGTSRRADASQRAGRLALREALLPPRAVAYRRGDELLRERVDDAGADSVQPAGGPIRPVLEFAPGVERGEDDLERAPLALLVGVDGKSKTRGKI